MELASLNQLTVGEVEDKISAEKSALALARTQKKRLDFFIPPPQGEVDRPFFFSLSRSHLWGQLSPDPVPLSVGCTVN